MIELYVISSQRSQSGGGAVIRPVRSADRPVSSVLVDPAAAGSAMGAVWIGGLGAAAVLVAITVFIIRRRQG